MGRYTQDNRPLRVKTVLGPDELLLVGFNGQEGVSKPFLYQLEMVSSNESINPKDLLLTPAEITIQLHDGKKRVIHGIIRRFAQHGQYGDLLSYRAELVPSLWFLSVTRDCRIFQNATAPDIIEKILKEHGISEFTLELSGSYREREYCVQYRETHLNFISRLMEEEGIFYFFKHEEGKHSMVLADGNNAVQPCQIPQVRVSSAPVMAEDVLVDVHREHAVHLGKVTLSDYDYLQPSLTLRNTIEGKGYGEVYDFLPVVYTKMDEGDRYARLQLEAEEAQHDTVRGIGDCRYLLSGHRLKIEGHYRADVNQEYMILDLQHSGLTQDYRSSGEVALDYRAEFTAIPLAVPYRPPLRAQRPVVMGSQTAVVVGPQGEEIWADKHGRVKIQFHWDRQGEKNEKSSCWVRVSSAWAGKGWGFVSLPRIGQEVIVDFLEGDPNRPVIVGRLYNAEQTPPFVPDNPTQSGLKSRSSKQGGVDNFNELRFEDKLGSELIYLHAEKDLQIVVENDETVTVTGHRKEEVKKTETITITESRSEEVGGDEKVVVTGERSVTVKKGDTLKVEESLDVTAKGVFVEANGAQGAIDLKANGKIYIQANMGIELKVGASTIKITPAGIELNAPQIKLSGTAQVELKAPVLMGTGDALLQLKGGAMAQVNGDGMLMLKGSITMIN